VNSGDLAGGFSDLEMTWFLYCAGAATAQDVRSCGQYDTTAVEACYDFYTMVLRAYEREFTWKSQRIIVEN